MERFMKSFLVPLCYMMTGGLLANVFELKLYLNIIFFLVLIIAAGFLMQIADGLKMRKYKRTLSSLDLKGAKRLHEISR